MIELKEFVASHNILPIGETVCPPEYELSINTRAEIMQTHKCAE